jgi:error-prone DNA polymerase
MSTHAHPPASASTHPSTHPSTPGPGSGRHAELRHAELRYAELHCASTFSFLRGASAPEELVQRAADLGYAALAITDECSVAGVVRAHVAARSLGLKLIIGTELRIDGIHLVLLAPSRRAYGQLSQLITLARRRSPKGEYLLERADLQRAPLFSDCLALWIPDHRAAHPHNFVLGAELRAVFGDRLWIALELHLQADDIDRAAELLTLSARLQLPMVAAGDVHMHERARQPLQDVLAAIRHGRCVQEMGTLLAGNGERHLRPLSTLRRIYPEELLDASAAIADRCRFSLDELRYEYPQEVVPPGLTPAAHLRQLVRHGARQRWPVGPDGSGGTSARVQALLDKELALIEELGYEHYFLTVHDIVHFAREQGILCQGRGSAANSAVCYCLFITEVDPARMNVLFERFISKERQEPPDIDVDFEHERREEVIQYLYRRYGRDRAALTATLITYRPRSAVRDVGKALGLESELVDLLARSLSWWDSQADLRERFAEAGIDPDSPVIDRFVTLVRQLLGFPRHLSQHVGGFVISAGPLAELVPIENAAMAERTVIQWDKDDLDALGLLKVDVLALGMLTAIRRAIDLANLYRERHRCLPYLPRLAFSNIPAEDPATYAMLQQADSTGVFQVESRAQMAMLPRLKPKAFYDLVIEVAIVRPGPIQGNMVHPYLRRRTGEEPVHYPNAAVEGVLGRTLGVPIFQEQVIQLAMAAAGFSAGEADALRRAMAAWRRRGGLEAFEEKLVNGMLERGHDRDFAERVFAQIRGFGEYGFPESHAASFALLVYVSAWLKRHEPAAFCCALLNSQPMGFYSPSQLTQDARRHGVDVLPVDVMTSAVDHALVPPERHAPALPEFDYAYARPQPAIRLGLRLVKGLDAAAAERIVTARAQAAFSDVDDLARRAALDQGDLRRLADAGALETLGGHRHAAHWAVQGILGDAHLPVPDVPAELPATDRAAEMLADYAHLGLSLRAHPLQLLRPRPPFRQCTMTRALARTQHGRFVRVAGVVTGRQRPGTASGVIFMTLEDETGNANVVIWNSVLARFRPVVLHAKLVLVKGVVEREGAVVHLVAGHLQDLDHHLGTLDVQSRDFH